MGIGRNMASSIRTSLCDLREQAHWYHIGYALYVTFNFAYLHDALPLIGGMGLTQAVGALFLGIFFGVRLLCFLGCAVLSLVRPNISTSSATAAFGSLLLVIGITLSAMVLRIPSLSFGATETALLLALSAALLGVGDALVLVMWGCFCGTLSLRTTYLFVLASYIAALLAVTLLASLPPLVLVIGAWATFAAMPFLISRSLSGAHVSEQKPNASVARRSVQALWRPVLLTALFALLSNFMILVSGQQSVEASSAQFTSSLVTFVVVLLLLLPALVSAKTVNIAVAYRIALPLATGGFLLLAFLWNSGGGMANSLVAMGWLIADVISWCMIAEAVREMQAPPFLLFGIGEAVISFMSLAGVALGLLFASRLGTEIVTLLALALVVVYLFSTIVLFVLKDRALISAQPGKIDTTSGANSEGGSAPAPEPVLIVEDRVRHSCAALAERAQLTPRETDALGYLAQGRSTQYMAEHLCISENTVKSHVRNVYQKLGVHSKQDIIDIINADDSPSSDTIPHEGE